MDSKDYEVIKVPISDIIGRDKNETTCRVSADGRKITATLSIMRKDFSPSVFAIELRDSTSANSTYYLTFYMDELKSVSISNQRNTFIIEPSSIPSCFQARMKEKVSSAYFSDIEVSSIYTWQIICFKELPLDTTRAIEQEAKTKVTRLQQKKRARDACGNCDCCVYYKQELKKQIKKYEELEQEMADFKTVGMLPEFERDFYTPVVYNSHKLQHEVSSITKCISTANLVPARIMGMFNPDVLARANLNEEQAAVLHHETLADPMFGPKNAVKINAIRKKYGQEVLDDALRCWSEIDHYNASAGHPVFVPWDEREDREMTASEMVKEVLFKYSEMSTKYNKEKKELQKENDELRKRLEELDVTTPEQATSDDINNGIIEERREARTPCTIM